MVVFFFKGMKLKGVIEERLPIVWYWIGEVKLLEVV